MQKVRKLVTTIMIAALITAMEGTTILSLSHHVKADTNTVSQTSQAENDLTKYKKINGRHKAVAFKHGDKTARQQHPPGGVVPPYQRLAAGNGPRAHVYLGLIPHLHFTVGQGVFQLAV